MLLPGKLYSRKLKRCVVGVEIEHSRYSTNAPADQISRVRAGRGDGPVIIMKFAFWPVR